MKIIERTQKQESTSKIHKQASTPTRPSALTFDLVGGGGAHLRLAVLEQRLEGRDQVVLGDLGPDRLLQLQHAGGNRCRKFRTLARLDSSHERTNGSSDTQTFRAPDQKRPALMVNDEHLHTATPA